MGDPLISTGYFSTKILETPACVEKPVNTQQGFRIKTSASCLYYVPLLQLDVWRWQMFDVGFCSSLVSLTLQSDHLLAI